jgi:DNA invertase Pin-like site-specific DNA recombinase
MTTLALIYVRQSRHKEYERTVSPEDQEAQCRGLAAVAACEAIEVYRDLDLSGGSTKRRKGLNALLDRVKAGGVAVVAALDQSRAFRNTADALAFYALMEQRPEIAVVFVKGSFDRSAVGGFTYTTLAAAHELERRMAGEKTKSALRFMIARGQMVGPVPLGYRRISDGQDQRIELDPEWAPVVLRAFREYAVGDLSTRALAARFNAEGIKPLGHKDGFRADTLAQLLGNPAYVGKMPEGGRRAKRDAAALVKGQWPALVDDETWQAVSARLARYRGGAGGGPGFRAYAFVGLLRCAHCGGRLYGHFMNGRAYYHCRSTGTTLGCGRGVREDALLPWGRSLMEWLETATDRAEIVRTAADLADMPSRPPEALAQLEASLERVGQRFEWGDIGAEEYREKRERLLALRAEIIGSITPPSQLPAGLVDAWDTAGNEVRRSLLANVFSELDLQDGAIVSARPRAEVAGEVARKLAAWGQALRLRFG